MTTRDHRIGPFAVPDHRNIIRMATSLNGVARTVATAGVH